MMPDARADWSAGPSVGSQHPIPSSPVRILRAKSNRMLNRKLRYAAVERMFSCGS
jgi:hypothetical protein